MPHVQQHRVRVHLQQDHDNGHDGGDHWAAGEEAHVQAVAEQCKYESGERVGPNDCGHSGAPEVQIDGRGHFRRRRDTRRVVDQGGWHGQRESPVLGAVAKGRGRWQECGRLELFGQFQERPTTTAAVSEQTTGTTGRGVWPTAGLQCH